MAKQQKKQQFELFRWLRRPYRLNIIDEQTLTEVATYRLKKINLYMALCVLILATVLLTVALLIFTPIKYYLPGFGNEITRKELINIQHKVDSLDAAVAAYQRQYDRIATVLRGEFTGIRDTNMIDMERLRNEKLKSYLPTVDSFKEDAIEQLNKEKKDSGKATAEPVKPKENAEQKKQ